MHGRRARYWLIGSAVLALGCAEKSAPPTPDTTAATPGPVASLAAPPAKSATPGAAPLASAGPAPSGSAAASGSAAPLPKPSRKVAGATTTVQLLDAGSEPRYKLRYQFDKGRVERAMLVSGSGLSMELSGQKIDLPKMPDMEMSATIRVTDLLPTGSARRQITIDRVNLKQGALDPSLKGDVEQALAKLEGLRGRDLIDTRGFIHELKLEQASAQGELRQFLESMQQALGQMGAPFPEEEVGKGARWQIDTKVSQQGINLSQLATYELIETDGKKGRAKISLQQRSPKGKVNPPGLPAGVQAELLSLDSRGNGEMKFDLARMVPDGHVTTKSKIRVRTQVPAGGTQDATMNVTARAKFAPAKN